MGLAFRLFPSWVTLPSTISAVCFFLASAARCQSPTFQSIPLPRQEETLEFNKILQDETGFIWCATGNGLFRFDGSSYKAFAGTLPDKSVTALAQDSLGRLWAGFQNGAIGFIEKGEIRLFQPSEGLPVAQVSDMLFDRTGVLWIATLGDGIYYYFNNRLYRLDDIDGMPDLNGYDLEEDSRGDVWVGTDGGVAICSRVENSVTIRVINYANGLPDNIVKKISKAKSPLMILATEDAGVVYADSRANTIQPILRDPWTYGSIADFLLVNDWIWIASANGLAVVDLSKKNPTAKIELPQRATTLCKDAEGGVWAGTKTSVYRSPGEQVQWLRPAGDKNILAVTIGHDGDVWFSTAQGLFRRGDKEGKVVTSKPLAGIVEGDKKVISLYTDFEGAIWAGFFGEGVVRINPETGQVRNFRREILNGNVVNISGKNKTVWLATLGGASQIKIDKGFEVKNYSQSDGLTTDYLYQAFMDSKDRVWFATDRDGIDMLDGDGFHHFKKNLDSKVVYGLVEDTLHRLWANVQNEGLFIFDGKEFNAFQGKLSLHNNSFNSFSSSQRAHLIAAHSLGLDIVDVATHSFHYILNEGNAIPNLNSIARDKKGRVFIGTNNGLIIYDHDSDEKQNSPRAHIDQFEVNGRPFDLEIAEPLKYNQSSVRIGFTGFWFQNPSALRFSYQLENFDLEWLTTDGRSVTYSRLPPGKYTFKLRASDSNDFRSAQEVRIRFIIDPPFWNAVWFYLLATLITLVAAYGVFRYRERKLLNYNRELETKVRQRTEEIQQKGNEIELQANEIKRINENLEHMVKDRTSELERKNKALEDYAFINAHNLRAPVARVLGLINLMTRIEFREQDKIYLEHLQKTSDELDRVVRSITQAIEDGYVESKKT